MNELEQYRTRCDELFADLIDCQEQLRLEKSYHYESNEPSSKRHHSSAQSPVDQYVAALLKIDCQHVLSICSLQSLTSLIEYYQRTETNALSL